MTYLEEHLEPLRKHSRWSDGQIHLVGHVTAELPIRWWTDTADLPSPPWADFGMRSATLTSSHLADFRAATDAELREWLARQGSRWEAAFDVEIVVAFLEWVPRLNPNLHWLPLVHPAGGARRGPLWMVALRVEPMPDMRTGLRAIARRWYGSAIATADGACLSQLLEYRTELRALGFDCDHTWRHLREGRTPST